MKMSKTMNDFVKSQSHCVKKTFADSLCGADRHNKQILWSHFCRQSLDKVYCLK